MTRHAVMVVQAPVLILALLGVLAYLAREIDRTWRWW